MVLEDDLAEELCKFKNQEDYNDKIVEHILHYYKPYILLSKIYMKKYYSDPTILKSIIGANNNIFFDESLEQLANKTLYKIILSKNKNEFPYINIFNDKIENNLAATFSKQEERTKAKEHFKALFHNAKTLFIYDNYLCANRNNQDSFKKFAEECFPKQKLSIFYPPSLPFPQELRTELKSICKDWKITKNPNTNNNYNYNELHDRYIIIDRKIQIILTSGIDYLMDTTKDFTYIIRETKE